MNTQEIAQAIVALWKQGKFAEAGETYWADDVVSIEAMGDETESHGKQAARAKGEWWANNHEVHEIKVEGPFVNGDQFAARLVMEITEKAKGQRMTMDEVALYRLKDGKIAEERFFY